jgi:hypothetical protein
MSATSSRYRSGCAVLATSGAWGILILAGHLLAAPLAQAQSTSSSTTLRGGVQQSATTGDVFNGASGPTNTNQPGVGGSPACHQIDPECGGTNRQCYNEAYHSTAIVMSVAKSQSLYQQTQGRIWIRCGACGSNVICWPNPGYQDFFAGRAGGAGPSSGQPAGQGGPPSQQSGTPAGVGRGPMPGPAGGINYVAGADPCRPKGPGGYDYCANGPGARLPPGCFCGSATGGGPGPALSGYVDSPGYTPPGGANPDGVATAPTGGGRDAGVPGSSPLPNNYWVNGKPAQVNNGTVTIPGGADTGSVPNPDRAPLQIGGVQQPGYWNPSRPFYNGTYKGPLGEDTYTIDVKHESGNVQNPRTIRDRSGAKRTGIVIPNFDPSGYLNYMWLFITQENVVLNGNVALDQAGNIVDDKGNVVLRASRMLSKFQVWPSNQRAVAAPGTPFRGF